MNILGISAFYHDSAACLLQDGAITAAAQEERFTRIKHDHALPINAIHSCLAQGGITIDDIDCVAFYEKPFIKFERILETYLAFAPRGIRSFLKAMPLWIKKKLWMKELMRKELGFKGTFIFPEHHESHAASAFFPSPYKEAAFLTIDGVGEWTTTSFGTGSENTVEILNEITFPHSLGLLYSAFTYYAGFKVNSAEYKVMGLAPYGEPKYVDLIMDNLIDLKDDGSFRLNMDYFNYCAGLTMTNNKFSELFGAPPTKPDTVPTQREMDLARSVQEVTEEVVLRMGRHIQKTTGMRNLCLAGGVALNCVANGKLLRAGIFDDIWIQPASGDAGGALGAALFAWHQYHDKPRTTPEGGDMMLGSYLGTAYSNDNIKAYIDEIDIPFHMLRDEEIPVKVAELLATENVVGWFQGRMEFGPRALGARSILGDARSSKMQEELNLKIKFRESFRPFAPSVLGEKVQEYFDLDRPSPYMLLVADVNKTLLREPSAEDASRHGLDKLKNIRSDIPAITHVDNSARVQSVHADTNPRYHALISEFDKQYGMGVIINTSFNIRGEPIVESPEDAFKCFMRTNMDALMIGNYLLLKTEQKTLKTYGLTLEEVAPD
ncbi:carbamoyltransferase [Nitrospirota bacterium]